MLSITDAAFKGFEVMRKQPRVPLIWAAIYAVVSLVLGALMVVMAGPALAELQAANTDANADPTEALANLAAVGPMFALMLPLGLLYYGVIYGAVNRIVLRPSDGGLAYLKIGADELRQVVVLVVLFLIFLAIYIAGILVIAVGGGLAAAANPAVGFIVIALGVIGLIAALLYVGVKLSLSSPQTFAEKRINIFGSWALTRGRFWPLLGAYLLAGILSIIIYLVALGIFLAIAGLATGGAAFSVFSPDMSTLAAFFTPVQIAYYIFAAAIGAVTILIWMTPPADIYRQLTSTSEAEVFA